jgi:hypothetical protein
MFLAEYISIRYCFNYLGYQLTNLCAVYVPGSRASYPWSGVFVLDCWRWPESIGARECLCEKRSSCSRCSHSGIVQSPSDESVVENIRERHSPYAIPSFKFWGACISKMTSRSNQVWLVYTVLAWRIAPAFAYPLLYPFVDRGTPTSSSRDLQRYVWTTNTSRADLV